MNKIIKMKKYYKQIQSRVFIFLISLSAVLIPSISSAQTPCPNSTGNTTGVICNPLGRVSDIPTLVSNIMGYVVKIGGVVAIFAFIYSGYKFVAARGNESELEKAKEIFFNTCIGVAILLGAQIIASIVVTTIKGLQS